MVARSVRNADVSREDGGDSVAARIKHNHQKPMRRRMRASMRGRLDATSEHCCACGANCRSSSLRPSGSKNTRSSRGSPFWTFLFGEAPASMCTSAEPVARWNCFWRESAENSDKGDRFPISKRLDGGSDRPIGRTPMCRQAGPDLRLSVQGGACSCSHWQSQWHTRSRHTRMA